MKNKSIKIAFLLLVFIVSIPRISYSQDKNIPKPEIDLKSLPWPDTAAHSFYYITKHDAKKVLYTQVYSKDSLWSYKNGTWAFKIRFLSKQFTDTVSKSRSSLFYFFEHYSKLEDATRWFSFAMKENQNAGHVEKLDGIGEEAIVTFDTLNNPAIFARKGSKVYMFRTLYVNHKNSLSRLIKLATKVVKGS